MSFKTFDELPLIEPILRAVKEAGYTQPTPIQAQAIPPLLEGRDLLGCAQTGTGKTAAFALPILNRLAGQKRHMERKQVRTLVLTPTRELAIQIHDSFKTYGKHLRLKTAVVFGGVSQGMQVKAIAGGVDILVATPGRLLDLINQRFINLGQLEVFVLDEADRMLDMGFINDIRKVIAMLPPKRHTLLFSATMPNEIRTLASSLLHDPVKVEVTPVASTAAKITQAVMFVERGHKRQLLKHILEQKDVKRVIVFTRTKHGANHIVEMLEGNGIKADAIHGNKTQNARQRALLMFRDGKIRVLVATDVMARGIDIDDVTHVINYDIPNEAESYVHRIGRTGRAGASGFAISFCDPEERGFLRDIEKLIGKQIPVTLTHPYHSDAAFHSKDNSQGLRYNGGGKGSNRPRRGSPERRAQSGNGGGGAPGKRNGPPKRRSSGGGKGPRRGPSGGGSRPQFSR